MKVIKTNNILKIKNGIHLQCFKNYIYIAFYKNYKLHNSNSFACFYVNNNRRYFDYYMYGKFIHNQPVSSKFWKKQAKEIIRKKKMKIFQ